jgi:hypothetical protein
MRKPWEEKPEVWKNLGRFPRSALPPNPRKPHLRRKSWPRGFRMCSVDTPPKVIMLAGMGYRPKNPADLNRHVWQNAKKAMGGNSHA